MNFILDILKSVSWLVIVRNFKFLFFFESSSCVFKDCDLLFSSPFSNFVFSFLFFSISNSPQLLFSFSNAKNWIPKLGFHHKIRTSIINLALVYFSSLTLYFVWLVDFFHLLNLQRTLHSSSTTHRKRLRKIEFRTEDPELLELRNCWRKQSFRFIQCAL